MAKTGIEKIELLNVEDVKKREVIVTMKSGSKIHIISCCESWQQYGGTLDEQHETVSVANKFNKWLHGKD